MSKNHGEQQWVAVRHNVLCGWHDLNEEDFGDLEVRRRVRQRDKRERLWAFREEESPRSESPGYPERRAGER